MSSKSRIGHTAQFLLTQLAAASLVLLASGSWAADTAPIRAATRQVAGPVLIRNDHNRLLELTITCDVPHAFLNSASVSLTGWKELNSVQLYTRADSAAPAPGKPIGERMTAEAVVTIEGHFRLSEGENVFWLSCRVHPNANLSATVDAKITQLATSLGKCNVEDETPAIRKRVGVALRRHWDDGVHTYRIPALATTSHGTLLCVYDMRRRMGRDLQEDIDIGLLRSADGGQTWEPQRVIMDMGEHGGLPQELNGVSDPGIIVDPSTGKIFCFAVWMHGRGGTHQWNEGGSEPGFEIGKSAQFLMVHSEDDGKTWSSPRNMTKIWKDPRWILYAPSPQQGIVLRDGTLVMPTQGRDADDRHFSNLLISRDHGQTWSVSAPASLGNTECQAVALDDGRIMLNCRSERPTKFRTVAVTSDLGRTWTPHATNRNTLIEPNCNGSLYRFDANLAGEKRTLLLFANPHSQTGRTHHSIQVSFDQGESWPKENRLLLDAGRGAGYPSLSRVDDDHIGIVYEGSGSHIVFERIPIQELIKPTR